MPKINAPHFATLTVPANQPRAAARHSKISQVSDDIYMVRGKMPSTPSRPLFERILMYFSRTMTIVRRKNEAGNYELTLINSIRLKDKALAQLAELGEIKHVVRLGSFHGVDDAFYLQRFSATYWVVEGMKNAPGLAVEPQILSQSNLPIKGSQLFNFENLVYPEAIIILPPTTQRAGVAVTTDAIQNHTSIFDIDNSPLVSLAIWRIGLVGKARLGPIWMRDQVPANNDAASLGALTAQAKKQNMVEFFHPQYERLLSQHDFDMLMPGHGWPIMHGAKEAIQTSMDNQLAICSPVP